MQDYHITIFYSDEDEGYIADIPVLPHCSAFGATPDEAVARSDAGQSSMVRSRPGKPQIDPSSSVSPPDLSGCVGIKKGKSEHVEATLPIDHCLFATQATRCRTFACD
jgi:hypothetical protein